MVADRFENETKFYYAIWFKPAPNQIA